jgi:holo-[acyl-carrier protein] synthase
MNNVVGIGTDIIECSRIATMIEKHDALFLERVYRAKGIAWTDIEITNEMGGKPSVTLHNAAREWCDKLGIEEVLISISHCNSHATAFATAIGPAGASSRDA